jgi:hypothetical protein
MKLRDLVLSQFEPDIAVALLEFGKSLRRLDADAFIFLARKSLCLYDVLVKIGIPPIERCVVSDRVLDMGLAPLRGKTVALIDDTLIVGTTIAKAKARLETECRATVTTHVFCVDQDWHNPDLAQPDTVALRLPDNRVMPFCAAEVRALSLVPRPYLVDFPLSSGVQIASADLDSLLSSIDWIATRLSTRLQEQHGVDVFTFFPSERILVDLEKHLGEAVFSCTDLVKVRVFVRQYQDICNVQVVPIVSLKPLTTTTLGSVLDHLLTRIQEGTATDISVLKVYAITPTAHQRLVQHILSISIGEMFFQTLGRFVNRGPKWGFDDGETARHYGPWLSKELSLINRRSYQALQRCKSGQPVDRFPVTSIPSNVHSWIRDILPRRVIKYKRSEIRQSIVTSNLLAAFAGIFLRMYEKRELPARQEAKALGKAWLNPLGLAPNRDRLESGITWEMLVAWLTRQVGIKSSARVRNLLSLMLDYCNDLGILVPITCCQRGTVFRAYRHGEDVRFSDSELVLAYHLVQGFLEASRATDVPRLVLEKMLVLMFKIGVARGFLDPLYGNTGTDGIGKVKFDLMGARPLLQRGPRSCADRDIWLSDYLVEREVLTEGTKLRNGRKRRGKYTLNRLPEGNLARSHAPGEAFELGSLIGLLTAHSPSAKPVLNDEALILLATCSTHHSTANALQVELHIIQTWLETQGYAILRSLNWSDQDSVMHSYALWIAGKGHYALYSAKLKYVGYIEARCSSINAKCIEYLRASQQNGILARRWQSYWTPISASNAEKETFAHFIHAAASLIWKGATLFSVVEIALCFRLAALQARGSRKLLQYAFSKLQQYRAAMLSANVKEPHIVSQISHRFEEVAALQQTEFVFSDGELNLNRRSVTGQQPFDPTIAVTFAHQELAKLMIEVSAFVDRIDPLLEDFGKTPGKHEYRYMLYYDIVDSTATLAGRAGADVSDYRRRIHLLKQYINRWFDQNIVIAKKRGVELFPWNGDKDSTNDCKYIFVSGKLCRQFVESAVKMLGEGSQDHGGLKVRMELLPCNFVGSSAFRLDRRTEVEGDRFWEHYSRIHKRVAVLEKTLNASASTLFVATDELKKELHLDESIEWNPTRYELTSEIAILTKTTAGHLGELRVTD